MAGSHGGGHVAPATDAYPSNPAEPTTGGRPFTLQEALPYSPQSSVIPFTPDLIPSPTIGSGLPSSSIASFFNRQEFESLNRQASGPDSSSKQVKVALDQVLQELRPANRSFFKFKKITKPLLDPKAPPLDKGESLFKGLSPMTTLVLERGPTFIKQQQQPVGVSSGATTGATTPVAPSSTSAPATNGQNHSNSRPPSSKRESPKVSQHVASNTEAHSRNQARFEVAIPTKSFDPSAYVEINEAHAETAAPLPAPKPTPKPASQPATPAVPQPPAVIAPAMGTSSTFAPPLNTLPTPGTMGQAEKEAARKQQLYIGLSSQIKEEEYMNVADDPDEPSHLSSRKAKDVEMEDSQDALGQNLNQRQRAETALYDLGRLTKDVFDSVGGVLRDDPGFGHIATLTSDREPALTAGCHQKLQSAIQKVVSLGIFSQVPLDTLVRTQKLSDVGLRNTKNLDYKLDESWSSSDVQGWADQLGDIETGLKAARTTLRIMCGGREEKQLYSEETIQLAIDVFKGIMEGIIIPVIEMRPSGPTSDLFKLLTPHKKMIASILSNCQRLFALLVDVVQAVPLSEMAVGSLEFLSSSLIFVENAQYDKESVIGVQKFDGIRLVAMDMLCQIFLIKPDQRKGIFNDLLTSLEKLPVGKQKARQFRLSEGGNIQPLSALIMRLIQASSGKVKDKHAHPALTQHDEEDGAEPANKPQASSKVPTIRSEPAGADQHYTAIEELEDVSKPLSEEVWHNTSYVVTFIVNRALKSTKSGDTPYRNLLDLFVEDFTTCMDSPDWPAAELILRQLTLSMMRLWDDPKSAAPAKNMALDILGVTSPAIAKLRSHVRKTAESKDLDVSDDLAQFLCDLALSALDMKNRPEHLVAWSGPFRATLEYLEERCALDHHLRSAITFLISEWAYRVHTGYHNFDEDIDERDREYGRLAYRLRMMLNDGTWLASEYSFKTVNSALAKMSYAVILLRSPFYALYDGMLHVLKTAMASDQATVRSKALKSVTDLIETDPAILDGDSVFVRLIMNCTSDSSPQVRDSALTLMGRCMLLRPNLEAQMTPDILARFSDSAAGVRKKAMKLARDIYLRNTDRTCRSTIANGLLHRIQDPDEQVRDLAKQVIEEVWFAPFYSADDTPAFKTALTDHVSLMIQTVNSGNVTGILDKVLHKILKAQTASQQGPFGVSVKLVANMFELIDTLDSDDPAIPHGRDALQVLQIFAKADPKLFSFEEMRLLKPHLASFSSADDMAVFRATAVIYRQVLPQLSATHAEFLKDVQGQLHRCVGKVPKAILDEVIACLWIIANLLDNHLPLARLGGSSLLGVKKLSKTPNVAQFVAKFTRYTEIIGLVGKHCDLDTNLDEFKRGEFANWKGTSVAALMVDVLSPMADASQPIGVRRAAVDAIGLICQAHPRNYNSPNVYPKFEEVFNERNAVLESAVLRSFKEFLLVEERRSEAASTAPDDPNAPKRDRNLTVMGGTAYDDVASATTQRFLQHITRISLATQDEHAFLAVEVLGSISRQGLVHPKETGVTWITLETSPVQRISEVAYMEHRSLHAKFETVVEREYVKAVQAAFNYQRDIVGDSHGATVGPYQAKLHLLMETLKTSKSKNRQKFIDKVIAQIDFDFTKLDVKKEMPPHTEFARFIIENVAFFEYQTVGEVFATVNSIEKLVTSTGSSLAHIVESEVFKVRMDVDQPTQENSNMDGQDGSGAKLPMAVDIDPIRLRRMTAGAMVLLSLWEARTYMRRLYSMGSNRKEGKTKAASKDMSKAPTKVQGITGDKFWEEVTSHMGGLESQESMMKTLHNFVELLNVDKEHTIGEEELDAEDPGTPSEGDDDDLGDGFGRKRKAANSPGGRKKKLKSEPKGRRGRPPKKQQVEEDADGEWD
ncbi:sister chromatid cohesion C-terminus-domain-containing protein [Plectosphaerella plurivora]|uniref:Sister chromatid cohesion protein n=1 Tax=Plectosphaerella plurivora TaxID=936078 RepID=A0A9P8VBG3_9PEZI|nr:sister chromatid cohesion C-terminus-domain-containing protein [Plectosphaerella plurivora]